MKLKKIDYETPRITIYQYRDYGIAEGLGDELVEIVLFGYESKEAAERDMDKLNTVDRALTPSTPLYDGLVIAEFFDGEELLDEPRAAFSAKDGKWLVDRYMNLPSAARKIKVRGLRAPAETMTAKV